MSDRPYWLGLSLIPGIGAVRFRRLIDYFGSAEAAWQAGAGELQKSHLDPQSVEAIVTCRRRLDLDREMEKVEQGGASFVTWTDASYPSLLQHVADPPPVLYWRGEVRPSDELALAVVGTRRPTSYGKQVCERLVSDVAGHGVTIVSGLARGIDAAAHRAALDVSGRTVAVLGCGVDVVYPPEHKALAAEIADHGALVSEFAMGTPPAGPNFPARNRVISGLSRATLVVEAGQESGALITSNFALEQGRDVFAIPGGIFTPMSVGTNQLIQQGAKLIQSAADILEELDVVSAGRQLAMREMLPLEPTESALYALLTAEPQHVDELGHRANLPIATVASALAMLELKGMARTVGGMSYVSTRRY